MKRTIFALLITAVFVINAGAATIWVDAVNDLFHSKYLYVPVGTTVVWTNYGTHTHTVTSNTMLFDSGDLLTGQSFSFTFNTVGDYNYACMHHPLMTAVVYVRNVANLTLQLSVTPVNPPIVVPPQGGSFTFHAQGTNQTTIVQPATFWAKIYPPNNGLPFQAIQKTASFPPLGSRGANLPANVAGTYPAGLYHFVGFLGSNPDSALAWSSFDFTKSASALAGTSWETVVSEDWYDVPTSETPVTAPVSANSQSFKLANYPEPFNPSTTIRFSLPSDGAVNLDVFNVAGARVATLINGVQTAGEHQVTFNASSLPSGLYLYSLNFAGQTLTNKMMLVK
jgi:plastocyanin